MARWEDLAWPLFLGAWALHDHMLEQARADRAEARLVEVDRRLYDTELQLKKAHDVLIRGRDPHDAPGPIEIEISMALTGLVRTRMVLAGIDVSEPDMPSAESDSAGAEHQEPDKPPDIR